MKQRLSLHTPLREGMGESVLYVCVKIGVKIKKGVERAMPPVFSMEKETIGFVMYRDYEEYFSFLSNEEKGKLLDALFGYAFGRKEAEGLSTVAALAFAFVKNQIDRDQEKYEKKCRTNRKNGSAGGRPPKKGEEASTVSADGEGERESEEKNCSAAGPIEVCEGKYFFDDPEFLAYEPPKPKKENAYGFERIDESEKVTEESPEKKEKSFEDRLFQKQMMEDFFYKFWYEYPKKESRAEAFEAFKKLSPDRELTNTMVETVKRQKKSEGWRRDGGRYIPHAKKWLEGRRWEDSTDCDPEKSEGSFVTDEFFDAALQHSYEVFTE